MRVFPIFSLMMPVNLIQYRGRVGMFNNRRFASSSLNYSYFSKKYHNYDTFTLAVGLIILTFCLCDDRDPPWINNRVKEIIYEKNDTFQCYLHGNKDPKLFNKVKYLQNELKSLIEANKEKYYSRILKRMINPLTSTKTYWSILKSFLNNKKIPCIPPLFHQNRYITKYKDKTELFNNFFANQCSLIKKF